MSMNAYRGILIFLLSTLIFGCEKDEPVNPSIETGDVELVSVFSFVAKGVINVVGNIPIVDYGFVYGTQYSYPTVEEGIKISLGKKPEAGPYERTITINNAYQYDYTYYVRAYITNEKGTVYGEVKNFQLPQLILSGVVPDNGKAGDIVSIVGTNFSPNVAENIVFFNNQQAAVKSATATQLQVEVPSGVLQDWYYDKATVRVNVGGQGMELSSYFKINPQVLDFSPRSGTFGTTVNIVGLDLYGHNIRLRLNDVELGAYTISNTVASFSIPGDFTQEKSKLSVSLDYGGFVNLAGEFTINPPTISSVTSTGIEGSTVTIIGTNFNVLNDYYHNYSKVMFNDVEASVQSVPSTNEINVTVPAGLTLNKTYDVTVFTGIHTVKAPSAFTLKSPMIIDFTPKTIANGSNGYITITGSNFGNNASEVTIGGQQMGVYSWTDTVIKVQFYYYLNPGSYKITVNAGGQSAISTGTLVVE